ncbi:MAG: Ran-binding zinc finger domain-containing protein [Gemmatimonadaceae bacterium]
MMEDTAVTIAEIRALVSERQRFDDWLTALAARREETPARVFERVHADYVARRNTVIANLHEHVGSLEALTQSLNIKLHALEMQLAEREDERAEAMLRTAVGEFDAAKWESTRHDVEASIEQLGRDREALIAEAEDARALLTAARQKPILVASAEPEPEPVSATVEVPAASVHDTDGDIETAFAVAATTDETMVDSGSVPAYPYVADQASEPVAFEAATERDIEADDAVDMLDGAPGATVPESLDSIDVFGESSTPNRSSSDHSSSRTSDSRTAAANEAAPSSTATRDSFDDLAFLRSVTESGSNSTPGPRANGTAGPTEQTKTLRCTECGTMNFPTEWYCERCGGELAAF